STGFDIAAFDPGTQRRGRSGNGLPDLFLLGVEIVDRNDREGIYVVPPAGDRAKPLPQRVSVQVGSDQFKRLGEREESLRIVQLVAGDIDQLAAIAGQELAIGPLAPLDLEGIPEGELVVAHPTPAR